jgi:hypothetical protein
LKWKPGSTLPRRNGLVRRLRISGQQDKLWARIVNDIGRLIWPRYRGSVAANPSWAAAQGRVEAAEGYLEAQAFLAAEQEVPRLM